MCGIFCSVSRYQHVDPTVSVRDLLIGRGPDASNKVTIQCDGHQSRPSFITCYSTVLSLRGSVTVAQPLQDDNLQSTLCWNGEAWTIQGESPNGNDTTSVLELLRRAASISPGMSPIQAVSSAMSRIAGPYAFVFVDASRSSVYFGRDFLGRRSLLYKADAEGNLLFSSVTDGSSGEGWSEVEADGLYLVDLRLQSAPDTSNFERWGDFVVAKTAYTHIDGQINDRLSVIPELSLNRELSSATTSLNEKSPPVALLENLLTEAVSIRVSGIPEPPARSPSPPNLRKARLAVLFSGGLDCTIIARICHGLLPEPEPIDLLNVAFENPRVHKTAGPGAFELCPDRITGRASHGELRSVCPGREWRFVAINVPYTETQEHRQHILALMHPHNTEMDLSISYALYFAARSLGQLRNDNVEVEYASPARVLLSGLGADELFAGYTRHATAFRRNGLTGLLDELGLDIARLGKRNLGRDDRVMSNWGKEARFPFLDEKLVQWALAAQVTEKCSFGEPRQETPDAEANGCATMEPGKKVLRCLAWKLGMIKVATEKKRAIQFGARTAKMEPAGGKTKGTHVLS